MPRGKSPIRSHYVLKHKTVDPGDGSTAHDKFKARLTAGGDMQWPGHDFDNTWAPVVKHATLRTLIAYALTGWV